MSAPASPQSSHGSQSRGSSPSIPARLGWVSFFNDCSSEVIGRALPLFLTSTLGLTPTFVGVVEGVAESVGILLRGFSGWLSDRLPSRKPLVVFGYSLSVLSRVCLLAIQVPVFFGLARILDRTGKGMRAAPRDAMVADAAALGMTGRAFGITRFLDALGAITGIAVVLAVGVGSGPVDAEVFTRCVWVAIPFGLASLVLLQLYVPKVLRLTKTKTYITWHIPRGARGYLVAVGIFALGNSSDAFIVLKAAELGYSFRATLIMMLVFNGLAALLAVPVGKFSDRVGRVRILALGWAMYAAVYFVIGSSQSSVVFAVAVIFYGAFYGFTEGTEKALLADLLPEDLRGVGYGSLQLVLGLAALPASLITGWLMTQFGSQVAFSVAACFAVAGVASLGIWWLARRRVLLK